MTNDKWQMAEGNISALRLNRRGFVPIAPSSVQRVLIWKATRPILLAVWSLGLLLPLACLGAYLPVIGPAQLRFQPAQTIVSITPPPLALPAPTKATEPEAIVVTTNHSPCVSEPLVLTAKSPVLCENNGVAESTHLYMGSPEVLVTPQMMVPYFQGTPTDDKAPARKFSEPVPFKPPVPQTRSKSHYSNP